MKGEEVAIVASVGATVGVLSRSIGLTTGNTIIDAGIGVGIAALGWYLDYDGVGDAVEGFGIGYFLGAVL
jgi:hypothetical protein